MLFKPKALSFESSDLAVKTRILSVHAVGLGMGKTSEYLKRTVLWNVTRHSLVKLSGHSEERDGAIFWVKE